MQPPRGPTFVSIPVDDWDRPCTPIAARQTSRSLRAPRSAIDDAAAALRTSQRPVFIVGPGVAHDDAWDGGITLAERFQAPVWASPMSARNGFPEDHGLFAGFLPARREGIVAALEGHDLILVLGAPVFTYHVEGQGSFVPDKARLIQLVDDADAAARSPVGMSITTSLDTGIDDLLAATAVVTRPRLAPQLERTTLPAETLSDAYLMQQIARLRPDASVIVEEAPGSRGAMHAHLPITRRDGFYTCASGGLGYGLPASIGIALAKPEEKVIALLGDGSSMYAIQGLWSAAQLELPITFIIVNNGRYLALEGFAREFGMNQAPGTSIAGLDFAGLARAQGVTGHRIDDANALDEALVTAFSARHPYLLEVIVRD
jgi:benzoylformate decarboxylase